MNRNATLTAISALILSLTAGLVPHTLAGPLNPPAGPVTSTYKTLAEVEPRIAINATNTPGDADSVFKITTSGSYYLAGNVTSANGKYGIEIAASNVTLDLNGFSVIGVPGSLSGVAGPSADEVTVKNGTVRNCTSAGVFLAKRSRVIDVAVRNCQSHGISVDSDSIVDSCTVNACGGYGIVCGPNSIVRHSTALNIAQVGIYASVDSLVDHCNVSLSGGIGIFVLRSRVENCTVSSGGSIGIYLNGESSAISCTSNDNAEAGILTEAQARVADCQSHRNGGDGIRTGDGAYITNCTTHLNDGAGISVGSGCKVEGNHCRFNGNGATPQAGILVRTGTNRSVLLNNNCLNNDWGIKIEGTGCVVQGNTCCTSGITNYEIIAGNRVSTIMTMPTSGAISGNTGGTAITDPTANFVY